MLPRKSDSLQTPDGRDVASCGLAAADAAWRRLLYGALRSFLVPAGLILVEDGAEVRIDLVGPRRRR